MPVLHSPLLWGLRGTQERENGSAPPDPTLPAGAASFRLFSSAQTARGGPPASTAHSHAASAAAPGTWRNADSASPPVERGSAGDCLAGYIRSSSALGRRRLPLSLEIKPSPRPPPAPMAPCPPPSQGCRLVPEDHGPATTLTPSPSASADSRFGGRAARFTPLETHYLSPEPSWWPFRPSPRVTLSSSSPMSHHCLHLGLYAQRQGWATFSSESPLLSVLVHGRRPAGTSSPRRPRFNGEAQPSPWKLLS